MLRMLVCCIVQWGVQSIVAEAEGYSANLSFYFDEF